MSDDIETIIIINLIFYAIFIGMFVYAYNKPLSSFGDSIYKYNGEGDKTLYNIVSEMKIASGLSVMPEIYILDSNILNAFACGTNPNNAKVVVSKGLLKTLNRDELQGVIGHEIAHIVNRDILYLLFASVIVTIIVNISSGYFRSTLRSRRSSQSSNADVVLFLIAIIFMILAPILANMFYFFLSRKREYLADACSAQFTRYPEGLASALKKISGEIQKDSKSTSAKELKELSTPLTQASFIVPMKLTSEGDGLFSTHPSTKNRINILLKMANSTRADLNAYNLAYESITHKKGLMNLAGDEIKTVPIREKVAEAVDISKLSGNTNAQLVGLAGEDSKQNEKENIKQEIKNYRKVEDIMWTLAKYVVIDCPCGTKLRLPKSYIGQIITCPHCKKEHKVIAD